MNFAVSAYGGETRAATRVFARYPMGASQCGYGRWPRLDAHADPGQRLNESGATERRRIDDGHGTGQIDSARRYAANNSDESIGPDAGHGGKLTSGRAALEVIDASLKL